MAEHGPTIFLEDDINLSHLFPRTLSFALSQQAAALWLLEDDEPVMHLSSLLHSFPFASCVMAGNST